MSRLKVAVAVRAKHFGIANESFSSALVVDMSFLPPGLALAPEHAAQDRLLLEVVAGKVTVNLRWAALAHNRSRAPELHHTEFSANKGAVWELPLGMSFNVANA